MPAARDYLESEKVCQADLLSDRENDLKENPSARPQPPEREVSLVRICMTVLYSIVPPEPKCSGYALFTNRGADYCMRYADE